MAEQGIQVSDVGLGQMTKILLQETMYQEKKHVICDTASDPGKYEAVVDISNKHKIFI